MTIVAIYEILLDDGTPMGCMTQTEFDYWTREGVLPVGSKLGAVLGHESAAHDAKRAARLAA